ncbi:MAG: PepSY domain-containing protein [Pseudorhodoplanes sp.]
MSAAARISGKVHKWLALLMAIQIVFWFVSGLFFAVVPIERVRSEHLKAEAATTSLSMQMAAQGLQRIAASGATSGERIELRSLMGRPVALVTGGTPRPRLFSLSSGRQLSPIPAPLAAAIAERDHLGDTRATDVTLVTEASPEYRGALPAWRVNFEGENAVSLYVAADTGAVSARRSTLWRVYDFLWSLHIMDFKNHEDFNTPLLMIATALALIMVMTGIILFPSRLGYNAWRRRRRRNAHGQPAQ